MREQIARTIYEWNTGSPNFYALAPAFKRQYYIVADKVMEDVFPFMVGMKEKVEALQAEMVQSEQRYADLENRVTRAIRRHELERALMEAFA